MELSFGARLRAQRERKGISLVTISHDTKIKLSLLDALERDDVTYWPVGIFRRAFVRDYARAIGLDVERTVREFLLLYPDPTERVDEPPPPPSGMRRFVSTFQPRTAAQDKAEAFERIARVKEGLAADQDKTEVLSHVPNGPRSHPPEPREIDISLPAIADLCTRIARVTTWADASLLLGEAAAILDASGMLVWSWEPAASALRPAWAHGYSDAIVARMPEVSRDDDNAIAAAFRGGDLCVVAGNAVENGAIVAPLVTPGGCAGVLAIELKHERESNPSIRALATIVAAQLAALLASAPEPEAAPA